MKMLKTTLIVLASLFVSSSAMAQLSVGGGLGFGTDVEELSAFLRGEYQFAEQWRGAATLNFFFLEDIPGIDVGWTTFNLDAHYILSDNGSFQLYGIGGLNIAFIKVGIDLGAFGSVNETTTEIGLNLGGGARLLVSERFAPFAELKYIIGNGSQLVIFLGAVYIL